MTILKSFQQILELTWHSDPENPCISYAWDFPDDMDPWDPTTDSLYDYEVYRRITDGASVLYASCNAQSCFPMEDDHTPPADAARTTARYVKEIRTYAQWWAETCSPNDLDEDFGNDGLYIHSIVVREEDRYRVLDRWVWQSWSCRFFVCSGDEHRVQWIHSGPFATKAEAEAVLFDGHCHPSDEALAIALGVRVDDVKEVLASIAKGQGHNVWKLGDRLFCTGNSDDVFHPDVELVAEDAGFLLRHGGDRAPDLLRALLAWSLQTGEDIPAEPWMFDRSRRKPQPDSDDD